MRVDRAAQVVTTDEQLVVGRLFRLSLWRDPVGFQVAQRSKALHLSARGVTTDPGLIPG